MSVYEFVVLIHILAAIIGLGSSFAMPIILKGAKSFTQARFAMTLYSKIEKLVKTGSLLLLLTGLILGFLNTSLFTTGWYLTSLIIYVLTIPITAGILPKKIKKMQELLSGNKDGTLPGGYLKTAKESDPYVWTLHISLVILVTLMYFKPF